MSILDAMNENVDKLLSSVFGENQLVKNIVKTNKLVSQNRRVCNGSG